MLGAGQYKSFKHTQLLMWSSIHLRNFKMVWPTFLQFTFLLFLPTVTDAHFPRPCITPEALAEGRCCPDWNGSPCGAEYGRGECKQFFDTRLTGLTAQFTFFCSCKDNFDSYDCSRCKFGYKGDNCTERQHYVRREILTLSPEERTRYIDNLHKAKVSRSERYVILIVDRDKPQNNELLKFENASVYDLFVWVHYYAGKAPAGGGQRNAAHQGPAFPFWHRNYLLFMEREVREITGDENFFIPYWDWTKTDYCNICNNDFFGASDASGRIRNSEFSKWKTICTYDASHTDYSQICVQPPQNVPPSPIIRNPGKDPESGGLPLPQQVQAVLDTNDYDTYPYNKCSCNSFRNRLEGFDLKMESRTFSAAMHNLVHDYFNGTMSDVPIAANDPLFMLHHAMIDKIFEEWLLKHPDMKYPIDDVIPPIQQHDAFMRPFIPPVLNDYLVGVTAEELGYRYE
ncbi:hypothetical protein AGOR_G00042030 [Albula goreensis]|uniref:Tyrosinase copper-binding domain-containing protein n=1 Tax=Albula goreensis TaxID=1534307 RepID=A0A8T3DXX5_9TELE|nr:hypothetical protein AGOR_G00042030 [Albula goreensis]